MRGRAAVRIVQLTGAALLLLGTWQVGEGGWIHAKAILAQHLLEHAWQRTLSGARRARPWPWADTWPVARLEVPRLERSLIVLHGANGASLPFGPGHMEGTAPPGRAGLTVLSGHRDTHFAFLRRLRIGDEIVLETSAGARHRYRVAATDVVDDRTVRLADRHDRPMLLLTTCYPFDAVRPGGPLRYVVTAEPA